MEVSKKLTTHTFLQRAYLYMIPWPCSDMNCPTCVSHAHYYSLTITLIQPCIGLVLFNMNNCTKFCFPPSQAVDKVVEKYEHKSSSFFNLLDSICVDAWNKCEKGGFIFHLFIYPGKTSLSTACFKIWIKNPKLNCEIIFKKWGVQIQ